MNRNIVVCIVLSIVTCGIYSLYWMVMLNDELNAASGQYGPSGGTVLLFSIITCGIYGLYWMYQMGQRVEIIRGTSGGTTGILFLLLQLFGLGIVSLAIMQSELNIYYGY